MNDMVTALRGYLGARYSADYITNTCSEAARFLAFCNGRTPLVKGAVLAYADALVRKGNKPASVQVAINRLQPLFRAYGVAWPLARRELHIAGASSEPGGTVLAVEDARLLIEGAKQEHAHGGARGRTLAAVIALSTTYGMRSIELARVMEHGIPPGEGITVQTAKGGRTRSHGIPPDVLPYLDGLPHVKGAERSRVQYAFRIMVRRYCGERGEAVGPHSARRTLVTELLRRGVDPLTVSRWMGWARAGMVARYDRRDPAALDAEVWPSHPFLAFWQA